MRTYSHGDTLVFAEFENLSGANAGMFRELLHATLKPEHRFIEVDLQRGTFMDSDGLGAVIAAHKAVQARGGMVRLRGAAPMVRELFRLTKFESMVEFIPAA